MSVIGRSHHRIHVDVCIGDTQCHQRSVCGASTVWHTASWLFPRLVVKLLQILAQWVTATNLFLDNNFPHWIHIGPCTFPWSEISSVVLTLWSQIIVSSFGMSVGDEATSSEDCCLPFNVKSLTISRKLLCDPLSHWFQHLSEPFCYFMMCWDAHAQSWSQFYPFFVNFGRSV